MPYSVTILNKLVLFEITKEFKFFNEFFLIIIDWRQGLSEIVRLLVIELHNPSFTVIEVHPFSRSLSQSESLVITRDRGSKLNVTSVDLPDDNL